MAKISGELARRLAKTQARLRSELLEELKAQGDDLEEVFNPYSYSPLIHELREKYLSRLVLIQGILQQLAHHYHAGHKPSVRVHALSAETQNELVRRVNRTLHKLNGSRVIDVTFTPSTEDEDWSALITYEAHASADETDETALWM